MVVTCADCEYYFHWSDGSGPRCARPVPMWARGNPLVPAWKDASTCPAFEPLGPEEEDE